MAEGGQEIPEEVDGRSSVSRVNSTNFLKLQKIVIDVGTITLRHLLQYLATSDPNRGHINHFFEFLNLPAVRCEVFQLNEKSKSKTECCICGNKNFRNKLRDRQWEQLYQRKVNRNCNNVYMSSSNEVHCCIYEAVMGVLDNLDVSLMSCILKNVSHLKKNQLIMEMIKKLKGHRDDLSHLTSTGITDDEFNNSCGDLRRTLRDLVSVTGDDKLAKEVLSEIDEISEMQIAEQNTKKLRQFKDTFEKMQRIIKTCGDMRFDNLQRLQHLENDENANKIINKIDTHLDGLSELMKECSQLTTDGYKCFDKH